MQLTNSQAIALDKIREFIFNDFDTNLCLSGSPGCGKTFLIENCLPDLIKNYTKATGKRMAYAITATTNKAASLLKGGTTIHKLFRFTVKGNMETGDVVLNTKNAITIRNTLIVIDEASMITNDLLLNIRRFAKNCKFLFVGDKYQLRAVGNDANVFDKFPTVELKEIVRQKDKDLLNAIQTVKDKMLGNRSKSIVFNGTSVKYLNKDNTEELFDILKTFTHNDKVITYTNSSAKEFSNVVRALQSKPENIKEGDIVLVREYCESVGDTGSRIPAMTDMTIDTISDKETTEYFGNEFELQYITFKEDPTSKYIYIADQENRSRVIKELAILGKETKNWKPYFSFKEGTLDLRTNEGQTSHTAQGSTYNRVVVVLDDIDSVQGATEEDKLRSVYVAMSRAKEQIIIFNYKGHSKHELI